MKHLRKRGLMFELNQRARANASKRWVSPSGAVSNPLAAERKILAGDRINAGKERPSDAALDGVNNSDFVRNELIGPSGPTHETPSKKGADVRIKSASQGECKQKVGVTFRGCLTCHGLFLAQ